MGLGRKRRSSSDGRGRGKSLKSNSVEDSCKVFYELCCKAGLKLTNGTAPSQLSLEQVKFGKNFTRELKKHAEYPEILPTLIEDINRYWEDMDRFRWSLQPCQYTDITVDRGMTDSTARLLLYVEELQTHIAMVLLDKLLVVCYDEGGAGDNNANTAQIIVAQLRWLDKVQDGQKLAEKIFEILDAVPEELQKDIILALPGIIEDPQHSMVAEQLKLRISTQKKLMVVSLDALCNLSLPDELKTELRQTVVENLSSADRLDLPIMVNFLLQSVTSSEEAVQVVSEIRQGAGIGQAAEGLEEMFNCGDGIASNRSVQGMVLDMIKTSICQKKVIAEAWLKCINSVKTAENQQPLDVTILIILHTCGQKKPVESMFRNKLRTGCFTKILLDKAFHLQAEILKHYFSSVITLAQALLHSPEPVIEAYGRAMYECSFASLDVFCQQEVIGSLITHIGSGIAVEVDAALSVLNSLVESRSRDITKFILFIKNVMDYIDNFTSSQLRVVYSLMSVLAYRSSGENGPIQDDLYILIRKQLTNSSKQYKRLGVIGGITVVQKLASMNARKLHMTPNEAHKQVITLLQLIRSSCNHSVLMGALCVDELANVIIHRSLDKNIEGWITENVINDFQEDYIEDIDSHNREGDCNSIQYELRYGLDQEKESTIALNLLPLIAEDLKQNPKDPLPHGKDGRRRVGGICLAPNLRLVLLCEKNQSNGKLDGVDALLGCAMFFPKEETFDDFEKLSCEQKTLVCNCLFASINWFIEVINGFSDQQEVEMKGKVIARLHTITQLIAMLKTCLACAPNFTPPVAVFDSDEPAKPVSFPVIEKKEKKPKAKKSAKKNPDNNLSVIEGITDTTTQGSQSREEQPAVAGNSSTGKATVDYSKCLQYFRELDMDVFLTLHVGTITRTSLNSSLNTHGVHTLQLDTPQLLFLLEDLVKKLDHALVSPATISRRKNFNRGKGQHGFSHLDMLSPANIAEKVVKLVPALCQHLLECNKYFQDIIDKNDGMLDGPGMFSEDAMQKANCLHLILQSLMLVFSWFSFDRLEKQALLAEALRSTASVTSNTEDTGDEEQDTKQILVYLKTLVQTVPDLHCAVMLCRLMACLADLGDKHEHSAALAETSQGFLKRQWFQSQGQPAIGPQVNALIHTLLSVMMSNCEDKLSMLDDLSTDGFAELMEEDENKIVTYPTLTRSSSTTFYKVIWSNLLEACRQVGTCKNTDLDVVRWGKIERWTQAVVIFNKLVNLIKTFSARGILKVALTAGRQFMELFVRLAMPMVDSAFRAHGDDLVAMLKRLQVGTRALHHLCGHSKIVKDVVLTRQVPMVKRSLETFVYRVKTCLTLNHCLEAFWLGNLKNRDLQGQEIVQEEVEQSSPSNSEADSEEELEQSDAEILGDDD